MGRQSNDKTTAGSHRDKNANKKLSSKISGWETRDPFEDVGIVDWMKRQTIAEAKRDKKNTAVDKEDDEFRFGPKRKCTAIENIEEFEYQSLHEKFQKKSGKKGKKQQLQKNEDGKESSAIKSNNGAKAAKLSVSKQNKENSDSGKRAFESLKVKDDFEVGLSQNAQQQKKTKEDQGLSMKRSRSVPGLDRANTIHGQTQPNDRPRIYRLPKWNSHNGYGLTEEDEDYIYDEGYVSKTPSAEEKEGKQSESSFQRNEIKTISVTVGAEDDEITPRTVEKVAKFSYTHQNVKDLPSLAPAKTATEILNTPRERRLLKASVMEAGLRNQEYTPRSNTIHFSGKNAHDTSFYSLHELRPVALVMRKVTIQDSPVPSPSEGQTENESVVENIKPSSPLSNDGAIHSERLQYPIHNNIPELRVSRNSGRPQSLQSSNGNSSRPQSLQSITGLKTDGRKITQEVDKSGAAPLPIGDLLPAVDKSIRNSHVVRSNRNLTMSRNNTYVPDSESSTSFVKSNEFREYRINGQDERTLLLQNGGEIHSRPPDQPLGPPPFRSHQTRSPLQRAREIAERRIVGGQMSNKENNQTSALRSGSPERTNTVTPRLGNGLGLNTGVRLSTSLNADRATKKKLRDAFSRFYNRRPFETGSEWTSELKQSWHS